MSVAEARADLAATLSDTDYPVHAYDAPKVVPGSVIIDEPEDGVLKYGDTLSTNQFQVTFNVWLFQDMRNLAASTKAMDTMVEAVVMNLGSWTLTNLRSHFRVTLKENGPTYLAAVLSVTNYIEIGGS